VYCVVADQIKAILKKSITFQSGRIEAKGKIIKGEKEPRKKERKKEEGNRRYHPLLKL